MKYVLSPFLLLCYSFLLCVISLCSYILSWFQMSDVYEFMIKNWVFLFVFCWIYDHFPFYTYSLSLNVTFVNLSLSLFLTFYSRFIKLSLSFHKSSSQCMLHVSISFPLSFCLCVPFLSCPQRFLKSRIFFFISDRLIIFCKTFSLSQSSQLDWPLILWSLFEMSWAKTTSK